MPVVPVFDPHPMHNAAYAMRKGAPLATNDNKTGLKGAGMTTTTQYANAEEFYTDMLEVIRLYYLRSDILKSLKSTPSLSEYTTKREAIHRDIAELTAKIKNMEDDVYSRGEAAMEKGICIPLLHVAKTFNLNRFDCFVLMYLLAPSFDDSLNIWNMYFHEIAHTYFMAPQKRFEARQRFARFLSLRANGLIEFNCNKNTMEHEFLRCQVQLPRNIAQYLANPELAPSEFNGLTKLCTNDITLKDCAPLPEGAETVLRIANDHKNNKNIFIHLRDKMHIGRYHEGKTCFKSGNACSFLFCGRHGVGKRRFAQALCKELGYDTLFISSYAIHKNDSWNNPFNGFLFKAAFSEAKLRNAIPVFEYAENIFSDYVNSTFLSDELAVNNGLCIFLIDNKNAVLDPGFRKHIIYRLDFPENDPVLCEAYWNQFIPDRACLAPDVNLHELATQVPLPLSDVATALELAFIEAAIREGDERGIITQHDLVTASILVSKS